MSNTSVKVAIALFMVMATPAASFARGGGGGSAGMGHSGGVGGVRPNAGLIGAAQSQVTNPSGMGNVGVVPIAPPRITVPTVPQFK
jgi:hypothetical protein